MSFEPLVHEYLGMTLIDKPHDSTNTCAYFSAFAHGDCHQKVPSLLFFCRKSYLIFQVMVQCFPEVSLHWSPHSFFPISEKLWHWLYVPQNLALGPPVPFVPERQHGAVKRACALVQTPLFPCWATLKVSAQQHRCPVTFFSSCIVFHWMRNHYFSPGISTGGQWLLPGS